MATKKTAAPKKSPAKKTTKQVWIGFDPEDADYFFSDSCGYIFFSSKSELTDEYLAALGRKDWYGKLAIAKVDSVVEVETVAPTLKELDINVELKGVV